jgi:hypothetical protein
MILQTVSHQALTSAVRVIFAKLQPNSLAPLLRECPQPPTAAHCPPGLARAQCCPSLTRFPFVFVTRHCSLAHLCSLIVFPPGMCFFQLNSEPLLCTLPALPSPAVWESVYCHWCILSLGWRPLRTSDMLLWGRALTLGARKRLSR